MYNPNESLAQRASRYNFDELLTILVSENTPGEVRRQLQIIYFYAAQSVFNENICAGGNLAEAFFSLQQVIEALDSMDNVKGAKTRVIDK
ncbi:MAG: hypothetical protein Q4C37_03850 [Bacteroidales bacterium]|nr:hypothetical protein [Bacteroidales bacterium]